MYPKNNTSVIKYFLLLISFFQLYLIFGGMAKLKLLSSASTENILIAFNALSSNKLRSSLTILIISIGIMALVGILTAIDAIESSLTNQFNSIGSNTFTIENWALKSIGGHNRRETELYKKITYRDALKFKEEFSVKATVSNTVHGSSSSTVKYKDYKSNPNIPVIGTDENYLITSGNELSKGRFLSKTEVINGQHVVVIGQQLATQIFKNKDPLQKEINIGKGKYRIIGILEEKGSNMSMGTDKICILPIQNVRQYFANNYMSYAINVSPSTNIDMEYAISEAEGLFRVVRGLSPRDASNFEIKKSDNLIKMLMENIQYVTIAATFIGFITLLGATISLMNIMLVSVKERTKEIGTRKALGAKNHIIRQQFLIESILIGEIGGILGVILGIAIGNIVALLIDGPFVIPWIWIIGGVILCLVVGLLSGVMPAIKASRLDPIDSLRYE